jgi:hypothetical protein
MCCASAGRRPGVACPGQCAQVEEIHVWLGLPFPRNGIAAAGDVFADFEDGEGGRVALLTKVEANDDVAGF